ncbi:MAG: hypothetical protein ACLUOI_24800 [Eisenbergiella sp.]
MDAMMQFTEGKAGFYRKIWAIGSVRDVETVCPEAVIKAYPNILQDSGSLLTREPRSTTDG